MAWDFTKMFQKSQQDQLPFMEQDHSHDHSGEISPDERKRRRVVGKRQRNARKTMYAVIRRKKRGK